MIKEANLSNVKFYTALGIKKPYFYDILSGKVNPPPPDRQIAMLRLLNPKPKQIALFFDLAAQERNEVPADIAKTLENKDLCRELRNGIDYEKLLKNGEYKNERCCSIDIYLKTLQLILTKANGMQEILILIMRKSVMKKL